MSCYVVTFKTNSEASRKKVLEKLKTYSPYCPIHDYCWAIVTEQKAVDIRNAISTVMEAGESIFVIRSGTEAAWFNTYGDENSKWLKDNL